MGKETRSDPASDRSGRPFPGWGEGTAGSGGGRTTDDDDGQDDERRTTATNDGDGDGDDDDGSEGTLRGPDATG